MGFFAKFAALLRVMRRRKRPMEALQLLRRRPALLLAVNAFETAQMTCGRAPIRVKALVQVKTSALIGCPF